MEQEVLKVENLSIGFGQSTPVLRELSFELHKGECLGIVGESGSGKSLTALCIMGLLSKKANVQGRIAYHSSSSPISLLELSEEEQRSFRRKEVAMVFQEPMSALNPVIKCGPQVLEGIQGATKEAVLEIFQKVKLPDPERVFDSYPHQLSGGQRQRVVISMALLRNAKLLIADEPTTALDATVQREILELMTQLKEELGLSLIFISHDLGVVRGLTDRTLVLRRGETIEVAQTADIFSNPRNDYTRNLIMSRPANYDDIDRLPDPESLLHGNWKPKKRAQKEVGKSIIEVKGLRYSYPDSPSPVIDSVDLCLKENETLGLVGESGSGKSTIGRVICGLIKDFEGQLLYDQEKLQWSSSMHAKIQMVFQDPFSSLNPRIKVGDAIMEPMVYHKIYSSKKEAKEAAKELLEKVGLSAEVMNKYPHEFSGGQRQRIVFARALGSKPKVIVCDESVSALDVQVQAVVLNLLKDLQQEYQFACLFISHDMSVVRFISDRVAVLEKGKIVEEGETDEVMNRTKHRYTKELLAAVYN